MKKIFVLFFLGFFLSVKIQAQIEAPDFLCVRGDTLFWDPPANACGPFVSYEVYASQDFQGTYALLASISDQNQLYFFHVNPGGDIWYFYLRSNYDCPGQTAVSSDTLDNRPPEVAPIQSVSVEDGQVVVTWKPSPSPEVFAYLIYRETPIGVIPVDTVFSGTSYTDLNAEPDMRSEAYFVNALDRCGNTSIFDAKHRTIFLEAELNPCRQSFSLNWNLYENWQNGVGSQELWVGVNGSAPAPAVALGAADTFYEFGNIKDGDIYCFILRAIEAGTGIASKSNEVCLLSDIVIPMRDMFIKNVTVAPNQEIVVNWVWDTEAEIKEIQILRSDMDQNYSAIQTQIPQFPLAAETTYTDALASPDDGSVFYKIKTIDDCDSVAFSTYGSTIHLSLSSPSLGANELAWTPFKLENAQATAYKIYKTIGADQSLLNTTDAAASHYKHEFDPDNFADARACYFVTASAILSAPDGNALSIESRSNTVCAEQDARIFVPNAFAPDGFNQEFKPLIALAENVAFEMHIYDRYGQELFVSTNAGEGWNGRKNGRPLPQGVYAYFIRMTETSGRIVQKKGTVLLLR